MKNKSVYVVILNWNHKEDLIETMESFKKQDYLNLKFIISDNGSTDGSQNYIKTNYPFVTLLENNDNLGWAAGNNIGIKYALSKNADYVLLANNDLYFDDDTIISTLVTDLMQLKDKQINIIGSKVYHYHLKDKLHNEGWIMYPKSVNKGKIFNTFRKNYSYELPDNIKMVDFVSGCFMMIDSSVFGHVGLIDEAFFIYGEETEFSLRSWKFGLGSATNTDLKIYHKVAATNKVGSPFSMYLKTRNLYYILRKHKAIIPDINYFLFKYYYDFIKTIIKILIFPKKYYGSQIKVLSSTIRGFLDGVLFKRKGKNGIKF